MDENALSREEIWKANSDLADRLNTSRLRVSYDAQFDIFMLTIGDPIEAITEQVKDGLQFRLDPDTLKISAFEIMGFQKQYLQKHPELVVYFRTLFEPPPVQRRDIPKEQRGQTRAAARNLVPAL